MAKGTLNAGYLSADGTKALSNEVKAKILEAPEGKVRVFRTTLYDADGNPVVLQGKVFASKTYGLTAKIDKVDLNFESVLVDREEKPKSAEETSLVDSLL